MADFLVHHLLLTIAVWLINYRFSLSYSYASFFNHPCLKRKMCRRLSRYRSASRRSAPRSPQFRLRSCPWVLYPSLNHLLVFVSKSCFHLWVLTPSPQLCHFLTKGKSQGYFADCQRKGILCSCEVRCASYLQNRRLCVPLVLVTCASSQRSLGLLLSKFPPFGLPSCLMLSFWL